VTRLWDALEIDPATEIVVDLERLRVEVPGAGISEAFPMEPAVRERLLGGLDDIGITMRHGDAIARYESARPAWMSAG
jgi:3-isopropylmalate/(R)-2-methylmalate dehydratase small subunit